MTSASSAAVAYLLLYPDRRDLRVVLQLRRARAIAEGEMSADPCKFDKANRSLMERLFEPPAIGRMSPLASFVAYVLLIFWSVFVSFPIYWVIITSFKDAAAVNQGPFYIPFVDFQPSLDAWRVQFTRSLLRLLCYRAAIRLLLLQFSGFPSCRRSCVPPMEPQICKVYLALPTPSSSASPPPHVHDHRLAWPPMRWPASNTSRSSATSSSLCVLTLLAICHDGYAGVPWYFTSAAALALFFLLARALGTAFHAHVGQRRHPVLDHLPAHPAAHRRHHPDLHDVPGGRAA